MGQESVKSPNPNISKLIIKPVELREASELSAIDQECNIPAWSPKLFKQEIKGEHSVVLGAYANDLLIGFIIFHKLFDSSHIVTFGVDPLARRQGVGKALLTSAVSHMHKLAIVWVTLEVRESNKAARKLYEDAGFNEAGIRQRYYSNNQEDALVLKASVIDYMHKVGELSVAI